MLVVMIDPDSSMVSFYKKELKKQFSNIEIKDFSSPEEAKDYIESGNGDLAIVESFPDNDDLYRFLRGNRLPFIVIATDGSERIIVESMRAGALDFIKKSNLKYGYLCDILARAFLDAERWTKIQDYAVTIPQLPEMLKYDKKLKDGLGKPLPGLAVDGSGLPRFEEGELCNLIFVYCFIYCPPSESETESDMYQHIQNIPDSLRSIVEKNSGEVWVKKNDSILGVFSSTAYRPVVLAVLEMLAKINVSNSILEGIADRIGLRIGVASGQATYKEDKGSISSEALNFAAHLALKSHLIHGILVEKEVCKMFPVRAQKYFVEIEPFEGKPVLQFQNRF